MGMQDETSGALKFVHSWTTIMFFGLLAYGVFALYRGSSTVYPMGLVVSMFVFAQFCLLMMIVVCQGVISTENRELEESVYGWYGQMGVLMVYSDFWYLLHCLIFIVVFTLRFGVAKIIQRRSQGADTRTVNHTKLFVTDDDADVNEQIVPRSSSNINSTSAKAIGDAVEHARGYQKAEYV
jgi:hypothetical protein